MPSLHLDKNGQIQLANCKMSGKIATRFSLARHFGLAIIWKNFSLLCPVQIEHLYNECVTDTQICGAKFCDGDGHAFAVTGYDLSEIIRYTQA